MFDLNVGQRDQLSIFKVVVQTLHVPHFVIYSPDHLIHFVHVRLQILLVSLVRMHLAYQVLVGIHIALQEVRLLNHEFRAQVNSILLHPLE